MRSACRASHGGLRQFLCRACDRHFGRSVRAGGGRHWRDRPLASLSQVAPGDHTGPGRTETHDRRLGRRRHQFLAFTSLSRVQPDRLRNKHTDAIAAYVHVGHPRHLGLPSSPDESRSLHAMMQPTSYASRLLLLNQLLPLCTCRPTPSFI